MRMEDFYDICKLFGRKYMNTFLIRMFVNDNILHSLDIMQTFRTEYLYILKD